MTRTLVAGLLSLALLGCGGTTEAGDDVSSEMAKDAPAETNGPPPPPDDQSVETATASPVEIDGITNKRLSFAAGTTSARIEESIKGHETVDYLLNVKAGQAMNISMATSNTAAYFNLLEPGETEAAVFNGSMSENIFEGVAAKSGDYRIRVYMMRSAARREETANYTLEVIVN